VEITPEREYLLVTEFFTGAVEIGDADAGDSIIDQGLALIRTLWDAGIAHRDIKPGNLMVRSQELLLIDVAFAQVRPSPWRQAVDLGNMMLVLGLRSSPQRVYRRALAYFTEAELGEAFAATRGVASPTQLRAFMKKDPRDLLSEFRALAPPRPPITLQRWSLQRIALAAAMLGAIVIAAVVGGQAFFPASVKELDAVYGKVLAEIRAQYTLGYLSTNPATDGAWRKVEIKVEPTNLSARTISAHLSALKHYGKPSWPRLPLRKFANSSATLPPSTASASPSPPLATTGSRSA